MPTIAVYPAPGGAQSLAAARGMGALAVAWHRQETQFAWCGMIQPAFTPATQILGEVFEAPARAIGFSLVGGQYDARFIGDYHRSIDTLLARGTASIHG